MPQRRSLLLGHLPDLKRRPIEFLLDASREGGVVPLYLPRLAYLVNTPASVKRILGENHANYRKGAISRRLKVFLGEGLLTSEGEWWRYQRRLLQPLFHRDCLENMVPIIRESTDRCLTECIGAAKAGEAIDIRAVMTRATTLIIGRVVLGVDLLAETDALAKTVGIGLQLAHRREMSLIPLPLWIPTPSNVRIRNSRNSVFALIEREFNARQRAKSRSGSILDLMMSVEDDQGRRMTYEQVRDQAVTLLMAGHVTTAAALSWLIFLIAKHVDCQEQLAIEARGVLADTIAQSHELSRLDYTKACFNEALRLYPPSWLLHREAISEDSVEDIRLKRGTNVLISPFLLHRHPAYWNNPEHFDPSRFTKAHDDWKFLYIPFGAGPRFCIGAQLAEIEAQIILSSFVKTFRIQPGGGAEPKPMPAITLQPDGPINVVLETRA